jgi:cytochrome P450
VGAVIPRAARSRAQAVPGPRSALYTLLGFARDPLHLALELTREYGDVVRLGFGGYYLISHPDHVQQVFQDDCRSYWKGRTLHRRSGGLFGRGLVVADGEAWRSQRRALQPALSARALPRYLPSMAEETLRAVDTWRRRIGRAGWIDVKAGLRELTQNIIARALFDSEVGDRAAYLGAAMSELGAYIDRSMRAPVFLPPRVPTPGNLRFRRAVGVIDATLLDFVRGRREAGDPGRDLLSLLLHARDPETGAPMSAERIRDELVTLFVAGHETATNALSWALYLLSKHPEVRRRLVDEAERVLGPGTPSCADLDRMTFAEMFLKEVLRLYPPAWMLIREPRRDVELGGCRVPAGASLLVSPYVTHHRPDVWENPEGFDPERFAPERWDRSQRFAWYPFGAGPRVCLGQAFAMAEMKLVLALVCPRLPLELVPGSQVVPDPKLTLEPRGALRMSLPRPGLRASPGPRARPGAPARGPCGSRASASGSPGASRPS